MITVGVAVVSYDSSTTLRRCLESVVAGASGRIELSVQVIDNSGDTSVAAICEGLGLDHEVSQLNLGFAAGCNLLGDRLESEWLLLLNPDAWLSDGFWELAAPVLEATTSGIVVPGLIGPTGGHLARMEPAPSLVPEIAYALGGGRLHQFLQGARRVSNLAYASGAALFIRRDVWELLGGFDERYFLFAEDADLFARAKDAGVAVEVHEELEVTHLGSQGTASKTPFSQLCLVSGKVTYIEQHSGRGAAKVLAAAYRLGAIGRAVLSRFARQSQRGAAWQRVASTRASTLSGFRWMKLHEDRPRSVLMWPGAAADSFNPYIGLFQRAIEAAGVEVLEASSARSFLRSADVFHVHWPDSLLNIRSRPLAVAKSMSLLGIALYHRARGTRVTWTLHNLAPHEGTSARYDNWYLRTWVRLVDGVLAHSTASCEMAADRFPSFRRCLVRVCLMPPLVQFSAETGPDSRSNREGVPNVLCFGAIRPYKQIEHVLRAFCEMPDGSAVLRVLGPSADDEYTAKLKSEEVKLGIPGVIEVGLLPEPELVRQVMEADLVVLPHDGSLNSASLNLAMSVGTPSLVPRTPVTEELAALVGAGRIMLYSDQLTGGMLAEALASRQLNHGPLPLPTWDDLARATCSLWDEVASTVSPQAARSRG